MNAALQDDSDMDAFGIAATLLPLSTVFGRKLAKGVVQFVYTLIQDHAVWHNLQFWEASFYTDVQKGIQSLYLAMQVHIIFFSVSEFLLFCTLRKVLTDFGFFPQLFLNI